MAPYEALYGRKCRSPIGWFKVGEAEFLGPNLVQQTMEKVKLIRDRLHTAQSRQKSYVDVRRRDLEFDVEDWVFLKCIGDPSCITPIVDIHISEYLSYAEVPIAILDRQVQLRTLIDSSTMISGFNCELKENVAFAVPLLRKNVASVTYPHLRSYDRICCTASVENIPHMLFLEKWPKVCFCSVIAASAAPHLRSPNCK
uniref:Uncharacterized protein n=2 Tax=Nicotiana TaxID=4085 RepID=A0A1S4CB07_TOBAC|nr:PREDICTED: uncharacterized protein LOC104224427 [Nicotiana sylvestris]XP_016498320.1 PREDICTED: uncharacterized protein LOC107817059 [Nicotiana tabacum]